MLGSIVAVSGLLLFTTYILYPLIIGALARLRPLRLVDDESYQPRVSVCIAAYNVEGYLPAKLESLLDQSYPADRMEIIVYCDGSTDQTAAVVEKYARQDCRVRLLGDPERKGKPNALNTMAAVATGELLVLTDSRQRLSSDAIAELVRKAAPREVACVTGNLLLEGGAGSGLYWRYENWIRRQEGTFSSVVGFTGPLSAVKREDFAPVPVDLILDDVWIPMRLRLKGRRIVFAEKAVAWDQAFEDPREFARKVRTLAGNYQFIARMPEVLSPWRNPSWLEFFMHKVLRLVCPWALAAIALSTVAALWLAPPPAEARIWLLLLSLQIVLYGAALGPRGWVISRFARTFVVLHVAAVVGLFRFLTNRQLVTW